MYLSQRVFEESYDHGRLHASRVAAIERARGARRVGCPRLSIDWGDPRVGCPRLSIDWGDSFGVPLLSPYEAYVAFGGQQYLPVYPMDYYARDGGPWTNYNTSTGDRRGSQAVKVPIHSRKAELMARLLQRQQQKRRQTPAAAAAAADADAAAAVQPHQLQQQQQQQQAVRL
ncbi:putative diphthamide synthesis domain-containing protein [Eimeria mitis]|uniref:Putative diphthamide synthesis domain-containing protein n=1 Tax=Eimeria mitis TaxID=44415 RepID=U6K7V9_9EIME|nr:putative diphthamide synthesis domain-containing protein [Eimeria mitis]CDJ34044.1 putative diphthamide synthesis domain-containing protein [Eimeria mitis]